jgi:methylated-DNA-[protein]-cysteine S-methyltransferase
VLRTIPAGSPVTYAELAAKVGRPEAVRALRACAQQRGAVRAAPPGRPHGSRVPTSVAWVGSAGSAVKRWLLDHESGRSTLTSL